VPCDRRGHETSCRGDALWEASLRCDGGRRHATVILSTHPSIGHRDGSVSLKITIVCCGSAHWRGAPRTLDLIWFSEFKERNRRYGRGRPAHNPEVAIGLSHGPASIQR
jgi:hypothetical protein